MHARIHGGFVLFSDDYIFSLVIFGVDAKVGFVKQHEKHPLNVRGWCTCALLD